MVEPGTVLLGKYRIERVLGKGGMGMVALAQHLHLDQPVAIKFLLPRGRASRELMQRFLREARAAVKLKSEHICRIHDVGTLEGGEPYMVMEYLEGTDLGETLHRFGPLEPGLVVDLVLQACEGLAEAHAIGIVHRDIKPSNLFVTRHADGTPLLKVLDFGVSKTLIALDVDVTQSQVMMGTPAYMSPEQMRSSKDVDARADIWALGVVLYELLSGRRPFDEEAFPMLCVQVATAQPPPLQGPGLSPELVAVVMRCLDKEPDQRFQDVAALAAALAPHARTQAQAASAMARTAGVLDLVKTELSIPAVTGARRYEDAPTTLGSSVGQMDGAGRRARWRKGLMAAGIGLAVAGGALIALLAMGSAGKDGAPARVDEPLEHAGAGAAPAPADAGPPAAPELVAEVDDPQTSLAASEAPDAGAAAGLPVAGEPAQPDQAGERTRAVGPRKRPVKGRNPGKASRPAQGTGIDDILGTRQ